MFGAALSTFNPKQFSGLKLWLDAANPSNNGTLIADNTLLSTWVDISGVSGNATQSTGGLKPTYKVNIQNRLPGVLFSGAQSIDVASLAIGSQLTLFTVSQSSNCTLFTEQSTHVGATDGFYIFGLGNATAQIQNGGASNVVTSGPSGTGNWTGTSTVLASISYDGSTLSTYKNGSLFVSGSGSIPNNTTTATYYIGSRADTSIFMTGYIFEIILYSGSLSAAKQALVNDYLRRKWAIY